MNARTSEKHKASCQNKPHLGSPLRNITRAALFSCLVLWFCAIGTLPAFAQRTVVTGTVTDPQGIPYAGGTIQAVLSLPVGAGGATLAGAQIQGQTGRLTLDSTGAFLMQLPDNAVVQPGGTQWRFNVAIAPGIPPPAGLGPQSFSVTLTITGASQDISAQLNAAAPRLGAGPLGGTHSGIETFTGNTNILRLGNRRIVCKHDGTSQNWAGADVSVWIAAAIADIVANSAGLGTVDAQDCVGAQTISQEIDVGNNAATTKIALLLPPSGTWTVTITNGTSCGVKQFNSTSLIGSGPVTNSLAIVSQASTNVNSLYCTDPSPVGGGSYVRAEGFQLSNTAGGTMAVAAMNVQKVFDNSVFRGITIANYSATDGLRVYSACCGTSFINITSNSNGTGKRPVFIQADSSTFNQDISFYSLSADHPGSGFANVEISGGPAAPSDSVNNVINFYGLFTEEVTSNPNFGLKVIDARGVHIYGWKYNGPSAANASLVGLDISQTAANQVRTIDIYGYKYQSSGGNGINNHITGHTEMPSTRFKGHYFYGGSGGTQVSMPTTIEDNELDIYDAAGVLKYQFATNGAAVFSNSLAVTGLLSGSGTFNLSGGASLLPADTITSIFMAGALGSPILGRIYVGNGSGWQLNFTKRTGSVDTDLWFMKDSGIFTGPLGNAVQTIASGTATMTTALIAAGACGTTVAVAGTGILTTDVINEDFNIAVTVANNGLLIFHKWATAGNVNFNYCNPGAAGITPTTMTVNWSVTR